MVGILGRLDDANAATSVGGLAHREGHVTEVGAEGVGLETR